MGEQTDAQGLNRRHEVVVRKMPAWKAVLAQMREVVPDSLQLALDTQIPRGDLVLESARRSGEKSEKTDAARIIVNRTNFHRVDPAYSIIALTLKPFVATARTPERSLVVTMPNPDVPQGDVVYKIFQGQESKGSELRPGVDAEFEERKNEFLRDIRNAVLV